MAPVIVVLVAGALVVISSITVLNILTFPRLGHAPAAPAAALPHVSILVPARNEAAVIGSTISSLLAQRYAHLEVLLLDDASSDGTDQCAHAAAQGDARLRVLQGAPLPQGWGGKTWACAQLAQAATGDVLLFTDADVTWQPDALEALLAMLAHTRADLLSVWPTQHTVTWGERLTVPLMGFVILGYLPYLAVARAPYRALAAANGQCMVFRRAAYDHVGGHAAVAHEIVEDIRLAQRVKAAGLRLAMADGAGLVTCRMYTGWRSAFDGYAKNIVAGYGGSLVALGAGTVFHWAILLGPWAWLLLGDVAGLRGWPWVPLTLAALGVGVRALTAWFTRQRVADALTLPLSALVFTGIAARGAYWQVRYGGPRWKGRTLARPRKPTPTGRSS